MLLFFDSVIHRISVSNSRLAPTLPCGSASVQMNMAQPMACIPTLPNIKTKQDLIDLFIMCTLTLLYHNISTQMITIPPIVGKNRNKIFNG